MPKSFHVVIVGGGFSGIALATQLLRQASRLHLTLLEAGGRLGAGVAYSTAEGAHVLNTRAEQMNLISEERHFIRWSKRVGTPVAASDFVARRAFGDYVEDTFIETIGSAASRDVEIDIKTYTHVVDVACQPNRFCVALGNGQSIHCNAVVLATGLPLSSDPLEPWLSPDSARYLRNPWHQESFDSISVDERVLLLGTGLTMIDVALMLDRRGHRMPIAALSRRGLLPRAHCEPVQELSGDLRMSLQASMAGSNLRQIVRTVRRTVRAASERGQSWHTVIDAMRPVTSTAWAKMQAADRRRFVRWLRPYWDVHRHRLAPAPAAAIDAMLADGRLGVNAGRVRRAYEEGEQIVVETRLRGSAKSSRHAFDRVINCTGPDYAARSAPDLERRLIARGLLSPDPFGLGYKTGPIGEAFGTGGIVPHLFLMGPACRPWNFEHVAVPELRRQADMLAARLLNRGSKGQRSVAKVLPFGRRRREAAAY